MSFPVPGRLNESGISLVEILIDSAVLAVVSLAVVLMYQSTTRKSVANNDKAYATQKAIQLLQELQVAAVTAGSDAVNVLDAYDDNGACNRVLTVNKDVTNPADPLSGNVGQRYCRTITISAITNNPAARRVSVTVYTASTHAFLADTMAIIQNPMKTFVPTQVYDLYVLALEAMDYGWTGWGSMAPVKAMLGNVIQDLQSRRPGIQMRVHWITQMSYGRDPFYAPSLNVAKATTDSGALPWVYLYPGAVSGGGYYYDPNLINGRMLVDGSLWSGPMRYSMTDAYNHAVRYPDEEQLYAGATTYAAANNLPIPEMSWRMLLEKMNSNPTSLQNVLLINLHGELIPFPAMHNYSDAAKDPVGSPYQRVVTHPEQLAYSANTDVSLRVYAYVATGTVSTANIPITVSLPNLGVANFNNVVVKRLTGNSTTGYQWITATAGTCAGGADYNISNPLPGSTQLALCSTSLDSQQAANGTGLNAASRLYGLYYIPSETLGNASFQDTAGTLADTGNGPKNTARWRITILHNELPASGMLTIETWLGNDPTVRASPVTNLSRTYTWINQTPPVTEQFQFMGDARHMPYVDVKSNHGYNWYFATAPGAGYNGYSKASGPWVNSGAISQESGKVTLDAPRYFQVMRQGLLKTHSLWTNAGGWPAWWFGMGGDIVGDENGNQRMLALPWKPSAAAGATLQVSENSSGYGTQNHTRLIARADKTWVSLPWLGELYPDDQYNTWKTYGNLPTGPGSFYRALPTTFSAYFGVNSVTYLGNPGPSSLINGSSGGTNVFGMMDTSNNGNITTAGQNIASALNMPLPASIQADRAYTMTSGNYPPEWADTIYSSQRTTVYPGPLYYKNGSDNNAGLVELLDPNNNNIAFFLPIGLYTGAQFLTTTLATDALALTIRGYLDGGTPPFSSGHLPQLPLVTISSPTAAQGVLSTASSPVMVTWSSQWRRWDANPYTENYPSGYTEKSTPLFFNVKYSSDGGKTWFFADDGSATVTGAAASGHAVTTPYNWDISGLASGTYLLRVEAFRQNVPLHYAYHQVTAQVSR